MKSEETLPAVQEVQPANLLQALVHVATTPGISIDVIERMVALQERQEAKQAQMSFFRDFTALQAEMPLIHRGGLNKFTGSKYMRREDMHAVVKPLIAKYGFAFSHNEESREGDMTRFSCKMIHRDGHFEINYKTLQTDHAAKNKEGKPTRTGIQDDGSTSSYAARYLEKAHLNIAETDEDNDGNSSEKITDDQAKDLEIQVKEQWSDTGKFLFFMGVGQIQDILAIDWKKAQNAVDVKRRANEEAAAKRPAK